MSRFDQMHAGEELPARVSRLEAGLEAVARDVSELTASTRELAGAMRAHADKIDKQFAELLVSVTAAKAPRATDWKAVISAGALALAIGAATLTPIALRVSALEMQHSRIEEALRTQERTSEKVAVLERSDIQLAGELKSHEDQQLHPVGRARIDRLERELRQENERTRGDFMRLRDDIEKLRLHDASTNCKQGG